MQTLLRQLEDLWRDLHQAMRTLRRAPGHSIAIVSLLALGIGANAAIFSLVNALFIRDLPVPEPERLVILNPGWSTPLFEDFRLRQTSFSGIFSTGSLTDAVVTAEAGGVELTGVKGGIASGNYFEVLGVTAALGRVFNDHDDNASDPQPVMVISHRFWKRQFDGDPRAIGREIYIFGSPFQIVGVTPPEFTGEMPGRVRDFWVPLSLQPLANPEGDLRRNPGYRWLSVMGRLKPGGSLEQAQAEAGVLQDQMISEQAGQAGISSTERTRPNPIQLEPGRGGFGGFRRQLGTPLQVLSGAVAIVLLIVCANIATLLLARGANRQREIAVRLALGCSRIRLVRHLLLEALVLAGVGGLIGLVLAPAFARGLLMMQPTFSSIGLDLSLDGNVLLFALGISTVTAIGFSLVPALRASRVAIEPALRSRGPGGQRSRQTMIRCAVALQVALSVVLVAASLLFAQSLMRLYAVDAGFDRHQILSVTINARVAGYRDDLEHARLGRRLVDRISSLPGVKSVSLGLCAVLMGCSRAAVVDMEGHQPQPNDPPIWINPVSDNYFETPGMPLVMGRGFGRQDRPGAAAVAVVTEALARFYYPDQNPLGKRFTQRSGAGQRTGPIEIVGVVRDVKFVNPRDAPIRMAFLSLEQFPGPFSYLQVRTEVPPEALLSSVRQAILEVDPKLRVSGPQPLGEVLDNILARDVMLGRVSTIFGIVTLMLACFGVYVVISYLVAARTTELGIRLALGAQPGQVIRHVIADALKTVAPGIAIGVVGAWAGGDLIEALLFGVSGRDPITYLSVVGALLLTTTIAAYIPGRRASRIDPVRALRCE